MLTKDAMKSLEPAKQASVPAKERFALAKKIQKNLISHEEEIGEAYAKMKCGIAGIGTASLAKGIGSTIYARGKTLMGIRRLYEAPVLEVVPQPFGVELIGGKTQPIEVYLIHQKDKLTAGTMKGATI